MTVRGEIVIEEANVKTPVYDEWRRIVVVPEGLTSVEQGRIVLDLIQERMGGEDAVFEETALG